MNATPEFSPNECQFCRTWHTPTVPLKLFCSAECQAAHRGMLLVSDNGPLQDTVLAKMLEAVTKDLDDMFIATAHAERVEREAQS